MTTERYEWRNASFVDKLKHSYDIFMLSFYQFLRLGGVLFVFGGLSLIFIGIFENAGYYDDGSVDAKLILPYVPYIVLIVSTLIIFGAIIITAREAIERGKTLSWTQAIREGANHVGSSLWALVIYGVLLLVLFFIIDDLFSRENQIAVVSFLLWSILDIYFGFFLYAVILQGHRGMQSIVYSYELVKGQGLYVWFQKIGAILVGILAFFLCMFAVEILIDFVIGLLDVPVMTNLLDGLYELVQFMIGVFCAMFYIVFNTVLFASLRDARMHKLAKDAGV